MEGWYGLSPQSAFGPSSPSLNALLTSIAQNAICSDSVVRFLSVTLAFPEVMPHGWR